MRIIQAGKLPATEREQAVTCRRCNTHFGFFLHEVRFANDPRDGDFYDMDCPFCGGRVTFAASLVR